MSLNANNQHDISDVDRQTDRKKKRRFKYTRTVMIAATEGRLNELRLSSNVDSMFIDSVSYVHILSYQWIRSDNRRV